MFIDYLTLIMINLVAGTALLAYYIAFGLDAKDQRSYAAGFGLVGLLGLVLGLTLTFNWPLPGSYNVPFGETTTLFGAVFLGTAIALAMGWDLIPVSIYSFFAGIDAVLVGIRLISLNMTQEPLISGAGFIVAGLGGIFAFPFLKWFKGNKFLRYAGAVVVLVSAAIWAVTFYGALWGHMASFAKYLPPTMLTK
jgi:putative membrane protein